MKSSLLVVAVFVLGGLLGVAGLRPELLTGDHVSLYVLYVLIFQVGISIGSGVNLKSLVSQLNWRVLLIPLYGGRQRFCLLFIVFRADCAAERSQHGYQTGYRVGYDCLAGQYFP